MSTKETKYHIALDSQGYILKGAPGRSKRKMAKAPTFGNRFASGDRDYQDLSFWWFWAQTDWSGGIKGETVWKDDAKYYYSSNMDCFSEIGVVKQATGLTQENNFTPSIYCGKYLDIGGTAYPYVGTSDEIYRKASGTWGSISSGWSPANHQISGIISHKNKVWFTAYNNATYAIGKCDADGANNADYSAAVQAAMGWSAISGATCLWEDGNTIYVGAKDSAGETFGIAQSVDAGANWTQLVDFTGNVTADQGKNFIMDGICIGSDIYYLVSRDTGIELRVYDTVAAADTIVGSIQSATLGISHFLTCGRFLLSAFSKLIISVPSVEIWEYDYLNGILSRIFKEDDTKANYINDEKCGRTRYGGVLANDRIYWQNLIYDGEYFFNNKRAYDNSYTLAPLFNVGTVVYWRDDVDNSILFYDSSTYASDVEGTSHYIVFSDIEEVSTIEKLALSATINFSNFDVGEGLHVYYSIDGGNFSLLGSTTYALDGASITKKELKFSGSVKFRRLTFKILFAGDGTSTPKLKDISLRYLPIPPTKFQWSFIINCANEIVLLDGRSKERKRGEELRNILRSSFVTQSIMTLEDVDYAETLLNGALDATTTTVTVDDTAGFPERGRFRIDDEEISYTSKTATSFLACTRGARGTVAATHSDNAQVDNGYDVIAVEYDEDIPMLDDFTTEEYAVQIGLLEV